MVLACTVVTVLLNQYAQVHNVSVAHAVEQACRLFERNPLYEQICREAVAYISPLIIDL